MSLYAQQDGINAGRNHIDDQYDSKIVFRFKPLQGVIDGQNQVFQIPQSRIVVMTSYNGVSLFPQIYKDNALLASPADFTVPNPKGGILNFAVPPVDGNSIDVTFYYTWLDDIEWDHHLNRAANEIGFTQYYTNSPTVTNSEPLPVNGTTPSDIPDGLFNAICLMGASYAAEALSLRFATRYDTSAGDQSFSPSQMSKAFDMIREKLEKRALSARDDFYKGQGRQYRPTTGFVGYVLPEIVPPR